MDEFLAEAALKRLKPVAWQVLAWLIARRNVEPWTSLRPLERSDDALWRATRDLKRLGWIEKVEESAALWRVTDALRARIDGSTPTPKPAAQSFSTEAPAAKPNVVPSAPPAQQSFSPKPEPVKPAEPPAKPEPAKPVVQGFLGRPREQQLQALALWRRAAVRLDLLQLVLHRLDQVNYVHPDLAEAIATAERWASKLDRSTTAG